MKISTKSRYAIRLMIDIAENEYNGNVSMKEVSERTSISVKYLEQIVNILCKTGLVKSQRGSQGGYRLVKNADNYTVGNVIRAVEGDISDSYITDDGETVNSFWHGLYDVINNYMDSMTISDLIEKKKMNNGLYEYYI
ncbi:MAG: RrF2 family transcriptional regulator [Hominilimicola sp.]